MKLFTSMSKNWEFGLWFIGVSNWNPAWGRDVVSFECCVRSGRDLGVGLINSSDGAY